MNKYLHERSYRLLMSKFAFTNLRAVITGILCSHLHIFKSLNVEEGFKKKGDSVIEAMAVNIVAMAYSCYGL